MAKDPTSYSKRSLEWITLLVVVLGLSCASFRKSPEWDPAASAPESPQETWIPPQKERATPRSLDDLLTLPPLDRETSPNSDMPSPQSANAVLEKLEADAPPSTTNDPLDLPQLIEIALELNPATRASWQGAKAAAARLGESMAPYYPEVGFAGAGGATKDVEPFPEKRVIVREKLVVPELQVSYTLLDFGRRTAKAEEARRLLAAANFSFNRSIQRVIYEVEASFYSYDAARALEAAARLNLELAQSVQSDVQKRVEVGLSTRPEYLLAKQVEARAIYDLESSKVGVNNSRAKLALAMGLPANTDLHAVELFEEPIPEELDQQVEEMIDIALGERPDLQAQVAHLRASEARLVKAKADFFPVIGLEGSYGGRWWDYRLSGGPGQLIQGGTTIQSLDSVYEALVVIEWPLFEGFSRMNRVKKARAERERERAKLRALELEATNEVWSVYYDYKAAYRKYDYGMALLDASNEAYQATLEAFDAGLSTIDDLLRAESDFAAARYTLIGARSELLATSARLGFALGNIQTRSEPKR